MIDYAINDQFLRIGKDVYEVNHIKDVFVIKHNRTQQIARQFLLGAQLALFGALISIWLGPQAVTIAICLFAVGVIYGITTCEQIELRARFEATDEAGDQLVPLLRATDDDQLEAIINIYNSIQSRLLKH